MCTVTGIPNPKVTWYRDNRDVTKESRYLIRVNTFSFNFIYFLIRKRSKFIIQKYHICILHDRVIKIHLSENTCSTEAFKKENDN
jgi:hypothetical protein